MKVTKWKLLSSESLFDSKWLKLSKRIYQFGTGKKRGTYFHIDKSNYVLIIAEDDAGYFQIIRQYRRGTDEIQYELPAGFIDQGETPIEAAERELREETGSIGKGKLLGRLSPLPGFCSLQAYVVYVRIIQTGLPKEPEPDEAIENYKFKLGTIQKMIKNGKIVDMGFISAIQIFQSKIVSNLR